MKKQRIFVSGIDTDCGKTYVTGLLAYHFRKTGINCITAKIVQTGCTGIAADILEHRRLMEVGLFPEDEVGLTCPFVYPFPASPHLAASLAKHPFTSGVVDEAFAALFRNYELVLVEGAGGLAVPLTTRLLTVDYVQDKGWPLVLVSSSRLGSINHTLLSIDYCLNKGVDLRALVYNEFPDENPKIARSSFEFLGEYLCRNHPHVKLIHSSELSKNDVWDCSGIFV